MRLAIVLMSVPGLAFTACTQNTYVTNIVQDGGTVWGGGDSGSSGSVSEGGAMDAEASPHDASTQPHDASTQSDGGAVPGPAMAVGYTTQTFNSTTLGTTPGTWQDYSFFQISQPAGAATQNGDGSLSLSGNEGDNFGATIATVAANAAKPQKWQGIAFGGGGYFEATLSFTGTPDGGDTSGVGFWACDVEHSAGYLPTSSGNSWIEIDDLETDVASDSKWGNSLHNWYNDGSSGWANPSALVNPVSLPSGGTFAGLHTYAFLWVPATASTQGYLSVLRGRCPGQRNRAMGHVRPVATFSARGKQYRERARYAPPLLDTGRQFDDHAGAGDVRSSLAGLGREQ